MTQSTQPRLSFRLPLDPARLQRARDRLRDYLHEQRLDKRAIDDVVLAIEEAMTNAVRHSGADLGLEVDVAREGNDLVASVRDHGAGFDVASFDRTRLPDLFTSGGRGLYLIAHLMDEMELRREDGIEVSMRKRGLADDRPYNLVNWAVVDQSSLKDETYYSQRQRALVEEMVEGFATLDWEYRITYGNEPALAFFSLSMEEVLGKSFWSVFPATRTMAVGAAIRRAMELGMSGIEEYVSPRLGRWLEVRVYPTRSGVSIYLRDIDERKRRELERDEYLEALLSSEERFRNLFENMTEGVALHELVRRSGQVVDYVITDVNPAFAVQTGLQAEDARGALASDLYGAGEAPYLTEYMRVAEEGVPVSFQTYFPPLEREFVVTALPLGDDSFATVFEDVTERRRVERQREELTRALRESEERFRLALRHAPVSVAAQDLDLVYIWAYNERIASTSDVVGRRDEDIFTAAEARRMTAMKRRVLDEDVEIHQQLWLHNPGGPIFLDIICTPMHDSQRRVTGVISAGVDLTGWKLAQEALHETDRLNKASLAIDVALHSSLHTDQIIQSALGEGAQAIGAETAALALHDEETKAFRVAYTHALPPEKIGALVPESDDRHGVLAMTTGQTLAIGDTHTDPRVVRELMDAWRIRAVVCAPLLVRGRPIGVLYFNCHAGPRDFTRHEIDFVTRLASSMSTALENASLYEAQQVELRQTRVLKDVAAAAASSLDLHELCERTLEVLHEQTDAKLAGVYELDPERAVLRQLALFGYPERLLAELAVVPMDRNSNMGRAVLDELPYLTDDSVDEQPRDSAARIAAAGFQSDRWIVVPLRAGDAILGAFTVLFAGKRRFRTDEIELYGAVAELLGNAVDKTRLHEAQRRTALTLQESLIHPLPEVPGLELAALSLPANQPELIGGDFGDAFVVGEGRVAVVIGDVAGKGIRAAGLTERVRSMMRALAAVDPSPAFILRKTNELLIADGAPQPHVTAFICVIDVSSGSLVVASAGHPPPVLLSADACAIVRMPVFGPPLGMFPAQYTPADLTLRPEECLLLYTDGLTEARRGGEMLGERRLVEALSSFPGRSAAEVAHEAVDLAVEFSDRLRDDLQVLALRLAPAR